MSAVPQPAERPISPEAYLARERLAETKSEYFRGKIYAMSGASRWHVRICDDLQYAITTELRERGCEAFSSDMRVKVEDNGLYTYPDLTVVCGEAEFEDERFDTLLNPTLIVEVLSPSTETYDRTDKFERYRDLDSLREYVLVATDKPSVETFRREEHGWVFNQVRGLNESVRFASINVTIPLAEIYRRVNFDEAAASQRSSTSAES